MNRFYGILTSLGLKQKEAKPLFLGLDNAGKTTLIYMLSDEYPTSEELSIGNIKFKAFDLGGHQIARRVWKDYYAQVDALAYLVDASEKERFMESKKELDALLLDKSLANVPFLVLGNKIDISYAASEDELRYYLGLTGLTRARVRSILLKPIFVPSSYSCAASCARWDMVRDSDGYLSTSSSSLKRFEGSTPRRHQ